MTRFLSSATLVIVSAVMLVNFVPVQAAQNQYNALLGMAPENLFPYTISFTLVAFIVVTVINPALIFLAVSGKLEKFDELWDPAGNAICFAAQCVALCVVLFLTNY